MQAKGFTLIEILLVIVIMTVLTAMVAPNFFAATEASVANEARYMQKVLRLASEEAQLSGKPVRCSVYSDQLIFELPAQDGTWQKLQDELLAQDTPKAPVKVLQAQLDGDVIGEDMRMIDNQENVPPLARFMLWPDGNVSAGEITLGIPKQREQRTIQLRAGAGGIRVLKPE